LSRKSLFMENTDIPAHRTRGEVSALMTDFGGVAEISHQLEEGKVIGFRFTMLLHGKPLIFQLPVRTSRVVKQLVDRRRKPPRPAEMPAIEKKAERIAWRQTLRWMEAQLAMVDTGLADLAEVFMPYLLGLGGTTFYEHWRGRLLAAPKAKGARS